MARTSSATVARPARSTSSAGSSSREPAAPTRPARLGFLGLGWIGLARMRAVGDDPNVETVAIADPSDAACNTALEAAPKASVVGGLDELLRQDLDGVVIATPSGQHAEQVQACLQHGVAVFCQKPLARTTCQTHCLVNEARKRDLLLGVDFCYRHLKGAEQLRELVQSGALGELFAIDLVFHNAYGPDKAWARDPRQSGGGCAIDLATHLVDLALWMCDDPPARDLTSRLYESGRLLTDLEDQVEDTALAEWRFGDSVATRLACSWNFSPGCDAEIKAAFYGSQGAAVLRNVDGSFYDFVAEQWQGSSCQQLAGPPDDWGGRALSRWAAQLAEGRGFDPDIERCFYVAQIIDSIYGR